MKALGCAVALFLVFSTGCASPKPLVRIERSDADRVVADFQFEENLLSPVNVRVVPVAGVTQVGFTPISSDTWGIRFTDDNGDTFQIEVTRTGRQFVVSGLPNHRFGDTASIEPELTLILGRGGRWFRGGPAIDVQTWKTGGSVPNWLAPEKWEGFGQAHRLGSKD